MKGKGKWIAAFIGVMVVLCCLVVSLVGIIGLRLGRRELPTVQIIIPHHGDEVPMGFTVPVQARATAQQAKIVRLQLWADGQLIAEVPGMARRLSGSWGWEPSTSGDHTLLVRAITRQGGVGEASVRVRAVESADQDGDNTLKAEDLCPDQAGPAENRGCPIVEAGDRDGDGIPDAGDNCPNEPGSADNQGCSIVPDQDGDNIPDEQDRCPDRPGPAENQGCPVTAPGDQDGDGVLDDQDNCPDRPGPAENQGCPVTAPGDQDGDGVLDDQDNCPDRPGPADNQGCPVVSDQDGDGIPDEEDICPDQAGPPDNQGCPLIQAEDGDGDGVRDAEDECPGEPGPADNGGCPLPPDIDGDSISNDEDFCPYEAGLEENQGCPLLGAGDDDGDGVPDDEEEVPCRSVAGIERYAGCPTEEAAQVYDRDGDGLVDWSDPCPDEASPTGCPSPAAEDSDGDGIQDAGDECSDQPGPEWNSGCSLPEDGDGDGVAPGDICPDVPGPSANKGCPIFGDRDRDGDGVVDNEDNCPALSGSAENDGCPEWVVGPGIGELGNRGLCRIAPWICELGGLVDGDHDGIPDTQDNCPAQAGPVWNGGCPLLSGWNFPPAGGMRWLCILMPGLCREPEAPEDLGAEVQVEVELGERLYTDAPWLSLWCYVQVANLGPLRLPPEGGSLNRIAEGVWDVGDQRSVTVTVRERQLLEMHMFCQGITEPQGPVHQLGEVSRAHGYDDWNSMVFGAWSEGAANSFGITYRMCQDSCP